MCFSEGIEVKQEPSRDQAHSHEANKDLLAIVKTICSFREMANLDLLLGYAVVLQAEGSVHQARGRFSTQVGGGIVWEAAKTNSQLRDS